MYMYMYRVSNVPVLILSFNYVRATNLTPGVQQLWLRVLLITGGIVHGLINSTQKHCWAPGEVSSTYVLQKICKSIKYIMLFVHSTPN